MTRRSTPTLYKAEREIAELVLGADAAKWNSIAAVWERTTSDPLDLYTFFLAVFTAALVGV